MRSDLDAVESTSAVFLPRFMRKHKDNLARDIKTFVIIVVEFLRRNSISGENQLSADLGLFPYPKRSEFLIEARDVRSVADVQGQCVAWAKLTSGGHEKLLEVSSFVPCRLQATRLELGRYVLGGLIQLRGSVSSSL